MGRLWVIGVLAASLTLGFGFAWGQEEKKGEKETAKDAKSAKEGKEEKAEKGGAEKPGGKSFDGEYVAEAATGDKIPHPLSKTTEKVTFQGKKVEVPEGMVFVPEGEFLMGEGQSEHKVWLDSYCIGKYEVTNAEWKAFVEATSFRPLPEHWKGGDCPEGKENHPVVNVSWEDAGKYCEWVSKETGRSGGAPADGGGMGEGGGVEPEEEAEERLPLGKPMGRQSVQ